MAIDRWSGLDSTSRSSRDERARLAAGLHPVTATLIAVVDGDERVCLSLVDLMRSHGFDAEPFYSADAILASANLLKSDCIIADIDMPGTSGIGLVQQNCRAD